MSEPLSPAIRATRGASPTPAPSMLEVASSPVVVKLALRTSVFVGSLLNLINQGDALLGEARLDVFKLALTYCVPYCVATYSATSITRRRRA